MSDAYRDYLSGSLNPRVCWDKMKYDYIFAQEHPEFFHPDGFICFCGGQGSGKTLSATQYIHKLVLQYPNVMVVANCNLSFPDWNGKVIEYQGFEQVAELDNGYAGIILFLDEIQSEFNSLESAKIDPSWFTVISQQRKRRLHVVGTAQVFERVAKCWREQFTACIICKGWFGFVQWNRVVDMDDLEFDEHEEIVKVGTSRSYIWFRDPKLYAYYDTWQRVKRKESATHGRSKRLSIS